MHVPRLRSRGRPPHTLHLVPSRGGTRGAQPFSNTAFPDVCLYSATAKLVRRGPQPRTPEAPCLSLITITPALGVLRPGSLRQQQPPTPVRSIEDAGSPRLALTQPTAPSGSARVFVDPINEALLDLPVRLRPLSWSLRIPAVLLRLSVSCEPPGCGLPSAPRSVPAPLGRKPAGVGRPCPSMSTARLRLTCGEAGDGGLQVLGDAAGSRSGAPTLSQSGASSDRSPPVRGQLPPASGTRAHRVQAPPPAFQASRKSARGSARGPQSPGCCWEVSNNQLPDLSLWLLRSLH